MPYSAPLFSFQTGEPTEALDLLTNAQWRRFAVWSFRSGVSVADLLKSGKFLAEEYGNSGAVSLTGTLPCSGLYGCVLPDGSSHT